MTETRKVYIQLLRDSPSKLRNNLLLIGPSEVLLAVCELALNVRENNVQLKVTSSQRQYIEQLADRLVPLRRKRLFLANHREGRSLMKSSLRSTK